MLKGSLPKRQVVVRGTERQTMDSENPIDDLKKIVPFEGGPDDSQEESEIRNSLLESIIVADPKLSPIQKTLRSLAGKPLWRRTGFVVPSFTVLVAMSFLVFSTVTSPSAFAEVSQATENSVNARSGVSTTLFEIVDLQTENVKYSEETVFRFEGDSYSLVHPDFEIRGVAGSEYIKKGNQWTINETLRNTGVRSVQRNSEKFKDFHKGGKDFRKISSKAGNIKFRGKIPANRIFGIREVGMVPQVVEPVRKSLIDQLHQASADFTVVEGVLTEILLETNVDFPDREPHLVRIKVAFAEHGKPQNITTPEINESFVPQNESGLSSYLQAKMTLDDLEKRRPNLCSKPAVKDLGRFEMMSWFENHFDCLKNAGEAEASEAFRKMVRERFQGFYKD